MYSRFSAAVRFALPPKKFDLERLPSYHAFQRGNLRFVLSQKISSSGVIFKGPRFVLGHPDADQIAGEIVTLRQRMQSLACNVFLSDLTLEFDAVGVVLGHGFHPWKARRPRSIPNPRPVHRQGRTPMRGHYRAPNRSAPCPPGTPPRFAAPATLPSDAGSARTAAAVVDRGPTRETQTGTRISPLEPRRERSPRWLPHGCAGMSAKSAMAALGAGSCTWRPSTPRSQTQA